MGKGFAIACLAFFTGNAFAEGYVTLPLASHHTHRNGYNEVNLGLGYEYILTEKWRIGAGFYRNSVRADSLYAGAVYTPWKIGRVRLGTSIGIVTGYGNPAPLVAPTLIFDGSPGVNVIVAPPIAGKSVIGIQLKWRLD